jgi:hypothetical protein
MPVQYFIPEALSKLLSLTPAAGCDEGYPEYF